MKFSSLFRLVALGLICFFSAGVLAYDQTLLVGGYPFPPYVEAQGQDGFKGATLDLLQLLNDHQSEVEFVFVPVAAFSRWQSFRQHRFDAVFFESPQWGWDKENVVFSEPMATDRDVYIAMASEGRDQSYFDSIENAHLIVTRGYHYGFAGYRTDEDWLEEHYDIDFSPNLAAGLEMLSRGRGDIAVLNESYLRAKGLLEAGSTFLISDRSDHEYELGMILRQTAVVDMTWLEAQLKALKEAGKLAPVEERWGIRFVDF